MGGGGNERGAGQLLRRNECWLIVLNEEDAGVNGRR